MSHYNGRRRGETASSCWSSSINLQPQLKLKHPPSSRRLNNTPRYYENSRTGSMPQYKAEHNSFTIQCHCHGCYDCYRVLLSLGLHDSRRNLSAYMEQLSGLLSPPPLSGSSHPTLEAQPVSMYTNTHGDGPARPRSSEPTAPVDFNGLAHSTSLGSFVPLYVITQCFLVPSID